MYLAARSSGGVVKDHVKDIIMILQGVISLVVLWVVLFSGKI